MSKNYYQDKCKELKIRLENQIASNKKLENDLQIERNALAPLREQSNKYATMLSRGEIEQVKKYESEIAEKNIKIADLYRENGELIEQQKQSGVAELKKKITWLNLNLKQLQENFDDLQKLSNEQKEVIEKLAKENTELAEKNKSLIIQVEGYMVNNANEFLKGKYHEKTGHVIELPKVADERPNSINIHFHFKKR